MDETLRRLERTTGSVDEYLAAALRAGRVAPADVEALTFLREAPSSAAGGAEAWREVAAAFGRRGAEAAVRASLAAAEAVGHRAPRDGVLAESALGAVRSWIERPSRRLASRCERAAARLRQEMGRREPSGEVNPEAPGRWHALHAAADAAAAVAAAGAAAATGEAACFVEHAAQADAEATRRALEEALVALLASELAPSSPRARAAVQQEGSGAVLRGDLGGLGPAPIPDWLRGGGWAWFDHAGGWHLRTLGGEERSFTTRGRVRALAFAPWAPVAAWSDDQGVRLLDLARGVEAVLSASAASLAFHPAEPWLLVGGGDVTLWDLREQKAIRRHHDHAGAVTSLAFSPAGSHYASGGFGRPVVHAGNTAKLSGGDRVVLYEVGSDRAVKRLRFTEAVSALAFSADGSLLGACAWNGAGQVLDVSRAAVAHKWPAPRGDAPRVRALTFGPGARELLTIDERGELSALDLETMRRRRLSLLPTPPGHVTHLELAAARDRVLLGSRRFVRVAALGPREGRMRSVAERQGYDPLQRLLPDEATRAAMFLPWA